MPVIGDPGAAVAGSLDEAYGFVQNTYVKDRKYLTATELRAKIYRVIDEVAETGVELEVRSGETSVRIVPSVPTGSRLKKLRRRNALNCTPDELVATSWEDSWTPE